MKNVKNKNFSWRLLLTVVLLIIGMLSIVIIYTPYYKAENRVDKVRKFNKRNKEKALGWLRVQGTNIDFPVVYYYDSDVSEPTYDLGWSFSYDEKLSNKTTIFSHNILNVSSKPLIAQRNHKRFEQLMSFIYTDFVDENKYIEYTTGGNNYLFKIYGVSFQKESDLIYKESNLSKRKIKKYISSTKKNSYFNFNVDVDENDKLITLVTCTRFFGPTTEYSFVVDGRLVRKNELVVNYKVKEKNNYKKIKKIMEGDVDNA